MADEELTDVQLISHFMRRSPVPIAQAIEALGIDYRVVPMADGSSGKIEKVNDRYVITVNANESPVRQRFTAAHELAHYLMHRDLLVHGHMDRLFDPDPMTNPPAPFKRSHEYQANQTAANILMPKSRVETYHAQGMTTRQIAERFEVSPAAMKIRLETLGLKPNG
ncbi:MAG: ImmA/IrrE family metallo-endopeptidase [Rhizobiaceae bacterium]|nr:ImmA/IrrE family metallo-endopeptidase [Rhizobiaceae bacterium]